MTIHQFPDRSGGDFGGIQYACDCGNESFNIYADGEVVCDREECQQVLELYITETPPDDAA